MSNLSEERGVTGTGLIVANTSPTIITPIVADLTNMNHTHANTAGGGLLALTSISNYTAATSWSPTVTGFTAAPTPTAYYEVFGDLVFISIAPFTGTSNNANMTITNLPFAANNIAGDQPTIPLQVEDNGGFGTVPGIATLAPNSTVITFRKDYNAAAWTNSGTKGVTSSTIFWYRK